MGDYKKHMIIVHKKENHEWMIDEIQASFNCGECELLFPHKVLLGEHMNTIHGGDYVDDESSQDQEVESEKSFDLT